jgi:type II secretory pathway component PulM
LDRSVEAAREDERDIAKREIDQLKARVAEQASEIEDLRAACAKPVPRPAESTPPQAVSGDEAKARMARVNNDRSTYQQQGLRPAGGEPWRGHTWRFE